MPGVKGKVQTRGPGDACRAEGGGSEADRLSLPLLSDCFPGSQISGLGSRVKNSDPPGGP